jgi:predicted amino acid dehydrogenase
MKILPTFLINFICRHAPPLIASEVTGLKSHNKGEPIKGWLLICPLTAQQLLNDREFGKKRIKATISLAEKLGAKIVGLGAITSSITSGGKDFLGNIKMGITNGRSLTVGMSIIGVKKAAKIRNLDLSQTTMAIVGATGSIGGAVSKLMINEGVKKFILVDRKLNCLNQLKEEMLKINPLLEIKISSEIHSIKDAEVVIVATSSPEVLIKSGDLKYNALVYDVTQPQNVSLTIAQERKDLLIIDGGIVSTPGVNYHFDLGLPPEATFACLAETLILAAEGKYNSSFVGKVKLEKVREIVELAKKYNFTHAPFTSFGKPLSF